MCPQLDLLDKAIEVGHQEMKALCHEDLSEAEACFARRADLIRKALEGGAPRNPDIRDRIVRLERMQEELSAEARKFRDRVKEQLLNSRKQTKRMAGYGQGARNAPAMPMAASRFVSKRG
jgi:hypothetical protein